MTPDQLAEIRERVEKATPGPWQNRFDDNRVFDSKYRDIAIPQSSWVGIEQRNTNAIFIAHAPTDIRYLLSVIDAQHDMPSQSLQTAYEQSLQAEIIMLKQQLRELAEMSNDCICEDPDDMDFEDDHAPYCARFRAARTRALETK